MAVPRTKLLTPGARRFYLDFSAFLPVPAELAETVSPTEVYKTQAEVDARNAEYLREPYYACDEYPIP